MLLGQNRGWHQIHHLLFVLHRLKRGAQGDLRLSVAHVAADQAVHNLPALHVALGGIDGVQLVLRLLLREHLLEFLLPYRIRPVRKALGVLSGCI